LWLTGSDTDMVPSARRAAGCPGRSFPVRGVKKARRARKGPQSGSSPPQRSGHDRAACGGNGARPGGCPRTPRAAPPPRGDSRRRHPPTHRVLYGGPTHTPI